MSVSLRSLSVVAVLLACAIAMPSSAQELKAEKAKAEKASGDLGLLDTEKKYLIVVTREGKLVTIDYDQKTKFTALQPSNAKMADIGLGSSADVQYIQKGDRYYLSSIEFVPAKGGD